MFLTDIKHEAKENTNFRKVIYTGIHSQLVLMSLLPGEEIGAEVHENSDQILFLVDGDEKVEVVVNDKPSWADEHGVIFVPAGTNHNIINKGDDSLKLYTVYAPSVHKDGTINATKEDAMRGGD
ncbi:cupin domain-containing protein [soil metagenome]